MRAFCVDVQCSNSSMFCHLTNLRFLFEFNLELIYSVQLMARFQMMAGGQAVVRTTRVRSKPRISNSNLLEQTLKYPNKNLRNVFRSRGWIMIIIMIIFAHNASNFHSPFLKLHRMERDGTKKNGKRCRHDKYFVHIFYVPLLLRSAIYNKMWCIVHRALQDAYHFWWYSAKNEWFNLKTWGYSFGATITSHSIKLSENYFLFSSIKQQHLKHRGNNMKKMTMVKKLQRNI